MAPEQAAADPSTDHRADLYALGLIAYEALAGAHPFGGRPPQAMVAAHLTESPAPLTERRPDVRGPIAALIMRLLEKRPDDRPASAMDVIRALDDLTIPSGGRPAAGRPARPRMRILTGVGIATLFAAIGAAAVFWRARAQSSRGDAVPAYRTPVASRQLTFSGMAEEPEYSRDGRRIAYVQRQCAPDGPPNAAADSACTVTLRVMDLGSGQSASLIAANEVLHPHWSADGAWIVVLLTPSDGEHRGQRGTYLVPTLGGAARRLAPPSLAEFGARGDTLLIAAMSAPGAPRFVRRVRAATGETIDSTPLLPVLTWLEGFHASPDGRWLALRLADRLLLATPDRRVTDSLVFRNAGSLRWSSRGDALYAVVPGAGVDAWLKSVRVDPQLGRFVGDMEPVLNVGPSAKWTFDIAPDGDALVHTGGTVTTIQWVLDLDARPPVARRLDASTAWVGTPFLSSDGQFVGYEATDQAGLNVYVRPFAGGPGQPLTHDSAGWAVGGWIPGTHRLVYAADAWADSLYAQDVPDGQRHVVGRPDTTPFPDGGTVTRDSTGQRVVFRTAVGAERVVALPDSFGAITSLRTVDSDGGAVLAEMLRAAAGAPAHVRIVYIDRASGEAGVVVDLAPTQAYAPLLTEHGKVSFATWVVGQGVGRPTLWRGGPGRPPTKVAELPLECEAGSVTMSADHRRFACLATMRRPDLFLMESFGRDRR